MVGKGCAGRGAEEGKGRVRSLTDVQRTYFGASASRSNHDLGLRACACECMCERILWEELGGRAGSTCAVHLPHTFRLNDHMHRAEKCAEVEALAHTKIVTKQTSKACVKGFGGAEGFYPLPMGADSSLKMRELIRLGFGMGGGDNTPTSGTRGLQSRPARDAAPP